MVYRIAGGIFFILLGIQSFGLGAVPTWFTGIIAFIAGLALLCGF